MRAQRRRTGAQRNDYLRDPFEEAAQEIARIRHERQDKDRHELGEILLAQIDRQRESAETTSDLFSIGDEEDGGDDAA